MKFPHCPSTARPATHHKPGIPLYSFLLGDTRVTVHRRSSQITLLGAPEWAAPRSIPPDVSEPAPYVAGGADWWIAPLFDRADRDKAEGVITAELLFRHRPAQGKRLGKPY